jgi:transposase
MPPPYRWFVGIDWATEFHQVCVLDQERRVIDRRKVEHSGKGIGEFVEYLLKLSGNQPEQVAIAIEVPRGAVVETLVERNLAVYSLNPKQMDRFRDRHSVAGAKDDSRDAFVMADSLRTDMHLFRRVELDDELVIRIRELSRTEEDVKQAAVRAGHQLRELLIRYYPQMTKLCPGMDEPWFWELIEMAPLPDKAHELSSTKVGKLLKKFHIRRVTAEEVLKELRAEPLRLAPGAAEAASEHSLLLLPLLRVLKQQREDIAKRIESVLTKMGESPENAEGQSKEHRDVTIILSLPGVGRVVTATMLAEASQAIAERNYDALRSYAGSAPITIQSGKKKVVVMRRSCNERLRNALYHWCRVSVQCDERSKAHYAELRTKGHTHGRALRGVGDRLMAVLISMLRTRTLYDPAFPSQANKKSIIGETA